MNKKLLLLLTLLCPLFVVQSVRAYTWTGEAPAAGKYYLYNSTYKVFLTVTSAVTNDPTQATCFTLSAATSCTIAYDDNGTTKYIYESKGNASWGTTSSTWTIESNNGGYYIYQTDPGNSSYTRYINANSSSVDYPRQNFTDNNRTWLFISEDQFNAFCPAPSLRTSLSNSSITATEWTSTVNTPGSYKAGNTWCAEEFKWAGTATGEYLTMTLNNLTNGRYSLTINGCASSTSSRDNNGATPVSKDGALDYASIHANNAFLPMKAYNQLACSSPDVYTLNNVIVTDGTLKIYVNIDKANVNWVLARIKSLQYISSNYEAVPDGTTDYTSWITNPDFKDNTSDGWSGTDFTAKENNLIEQYNKTFDNYQTISNLPNGYYKVKVQGFYRNSSSLKKATLYANGAYSAIKLLNSETPSTTPSSTSTAHTAFDGGYYLDNEVIAYVNDGTLKLGIQKNTTTSSDWTCVDYFRLYYLGDSYSHSTDWTDHVYNPSFETGDMDGWSYTSGSESGAKSSTGSYTFTNYDGSYVFNTWGVTPLYASQTISGLPLGKYKLEAVVASDQNNVITLSAGNNITSATMSGAKTVGQTVTVEDILVDDGQSVEIKVNSSTWFKADNFKLTFTGDVSKDELYNLLQDALTACAPFSDVTDETYANLYNTIQTACTGMTYSTASDIVAARTALLDGYDAYCLRNASQKHPYDTGLIKNPTYDDDMTNWSTTRSATGGGSDGVVTSGDDNIFQSTYNTHMRHETVYQEGIVLDAGVYKLSAQMKGSPKDDISTYIYATDGAVAHWEDPVFNGNTWYGYLTTDAASDWTEVSTYIVLNASTTIRIGVLSWGNNYSGGNGGAFCVDDWKLEKIDYVVETKGEVVSVAGPAPLDEINAALTDKIAAVDLTNATGLSSSAISTTNNANLIIYATSGQVSNDHNVVIDGTCATLTLVDSSKDAPAIFGAPTSFTATSAKYTMSAIASGSDVNKQSVSFGTLVLPFAASLPSGGKAYSLTNDFDPIDETITGTEVSTTLTANQPVLVTAAGDYTGSGVTVAAISSTSTYTNGNLTGVYQATTAPISSYVLQNHTTTEGVAFYLVGSTQPTVNPFRAYIPAQSSNVKTIRIIFGDGEETAINSADAESSLEGTTIYNVNGTRQYSLRKGINIVKMSNGSVKKVMLK